MTMTKPTSEQVTFLAAGSGASQRTVLDKLRDVVSVRDFGAVGDGVADDTAAFNNAVTAAGTRNVFVPGGSYKITGTVTGSFYSDATVTIVTGTVNTINRIGSVLSTTGALTVAGTAATGALTVTGTASVSDNVIISTSGKGIDFSATPNGSGTMTSELLDDYEEGTFTPVISGSSTAGTYVLSVAEGAYTKIGRHVYVHVNVVVQSVTSAGTGGLEISGMPFTSSSSTVQAFGPFLLYHFGIAGSKNYSSVSMNIGQTKLTAAGAGALGVDGTQASIDVAGVGAGDYVRVFAAYIVD